MHDRTNNDDDVIKMTSSPALASSAVATAPKKLLLLSPVKKKKLLLTSPVQKSRARAIWSDSDNNNNDVIKSCVSVVSAGVTEWNWWSSGTRTPNTGSRDEIVIDDDELTQETASRDEIVIDDDEQQSSTMTQRRHKFYLQLNTPHLTPRHKMKPAANAAGKGDHFFNYNIC